MGEGSRCEPEVTLKGEEHGPALDGAKSAGFARGQAGPRDLGGHEIWGQETLEAKAKGPLSLVLLPAPPSAPHTGPTGSPALTMSPSRLCRACLIRGGQPLGMSAVLQPLPLGAPRGPLRESRQGHPEPRVWSQASQHLRQGTPTPCLHFQLKRHQA